MEFIELIADASVANKAGETSVHPVLRGQYVSQELGLVVAQLLPEHGEDINFPDEIHRTPPPSYDLRSNFGPVEILQALLDHGANVNGGNNRGEPPLYQELEGKSHIQRDSVLHSVQRERCVGKGVGVHIQTKNHLPPLHLASFYGRLDIAQVLLDYGAAANSGDVFGRTPLHLVAEGTCNLEQVRIRVAQLLLGRGVDINAQDENNSTPLHVASYNGRVAIARVLLDHGAAASSKDNKGRTPLHSVAEGRYLYSEDDCISVVKLLLERGADVNAQDEDNKTPLHAASYYGSVKIAQVLLGGGASINSKSNRGQTPLHAVAVGGDYYSMDDDVLVARLLLECGAHVNASDDDNRTPLHLASYFGRVKMVLVLLNAGANASAEDSQGQTPLHLVSQRPHYPKSDGVSVTLLLLEHGADVNVEDKNHATPSNLASHHGTLEIASLLLHHGGIKADVKIDQRLIPAASGLEGVQFHDDNCPNFI